MKNSCNRFFLIIGLMAFFTVILFGATVDSFAQVSVPHDFNPGSKAMANEVNENFQAVVDAINSIKNVRRVVVAESGGDYVTISNALDNIFPDENNPYQIFVMPGTYVDGNITMKSYVHLQGSGCGVSTNNGRIIITGVTNVSVSNLKINGGIGISNSGPVMITDNIITGGNSGIYISGCSPIIHGNLITGNQDGISNQFDSTAEIIGNTITDNTSDGIYNLDSSPIIIGNTITENTEYGVYNNNSSPIISGNVISDNSQSGIANVSCSSSEISNNIITDNGDSGISNHSSSPRMIGNTITGHNGPGYGIRNDVNSDPIITHNIIIDNDNDQGAGQYDYDIYVDATSDPHFSFNIFNTIDGVVNQGIYIYNVTSAGVDQPGL